MTKKTKTIEIKDLPILTLNGVNYYAFNVALRYLKQHNKQQFKGMTMKKFKEQYGEDSIFKLTGCGSWITVELFNELCGHSEEEIEVEVEVEQQVEVVSEPISDYENQATFNDTEEVELVVEQEVETLTDVENEVYECDDNEEFNPYKEAEKMGFDLNSERYNTNDIEFKGCRTIEEIDKQLDLIMKQCGRDLSDVQHKRFVNCADFWALKLLAKEYDSKNV